MRYEVVGYVGGRRLVFAASRTLAGARVLRLRCYLRDFAAAAALLLRTGCESVPLRFRIEWV